MIRVQGMEGLGDSVYQRAIVQALLAKDHVLISTPWPELLSDLDVQFARAVSPLRTQAKNIARQEPGRWAEDSNGAVQVRMRYHLSATDGLPMLDAMGAAAGLSDMPRSLTLPRSATVWNRDRPIAVVRPVTERAEWPDHARSPDPGYVGTAAQALRSAGFHVILVADIDDEHERLVGDLPEFDEAYLRGELSVQDLVDLIQSAACTVGGVGWLLPFSIAASVPHLCVLGGHGHMNCPEVLVGPNLAAERVTFAMPDEFCRCDSMRHDCSKSISDFDSLLRLWMADL
ncbi:hypothetical protein [Thalassobaculum litoreum]|uniref:Uncharacterized protein n=1 Tax=Thalassobaculum litoreum DSM 18839 TaxID=1123362 RepID=A0A8G2BIM2_9PROT|nr:hypothetical protein [Thalassobaculum litoreum]SDF83590.1 hypothetical protein SAMN05660686_02473 [Thalassobaculum litoreum DSM 18839]